MKILLVCWGVLSVAAFCLSLASFSIARKANQSAQPFSNSSPGTYLTPTEKEVVSHLADRVEAERNMNRAMDEASRHPSGDGIAVRDRIDPSPFR